MRFHAIENVDILIMPEGHESLNGGSKAKRLWLNPFPPTINDETESSISKQYAIQYWNQLDSEKRKEILEKQVDKLNKDFEPEINIDNILDVCFFNIDDKLSPDLFDMEMTVFDLGKFIQAELTEQIWNNSSNFEDDIFWMLSHGMTGDLDSLFSARKMNFDDLPFELKWTLQATIGTRKNRIDAAKTAVYNLVKADEKEKALSIISFLFEPERLGVLNEEGCTRF